ncbi:hypothetical protein CG51_09760 [Haematobacter missouriensis]|uniref:Uncharacterized protein n=1 Tax=Haematobacter missouriensis TaxID=366616 RepID=A0A212AW25_9RHOB|nr:hypothetical protein CG51_09760 [Haematobacter missouriensis]OWJ75615.1 hypothetical protein CDV53_09980 [Haematobacter missouriensis]OWJ85626.1 hypothetical protein CDV52_04540 [Haematobacter missouriensis]
MSWLLKSLQALKWDRSKSDDIWTALVGSRPDFAISRASVRYFKIFRQPVRQTAGFRHGR